MSHADLVRQARAPRSVAIVGADVEGVELACLLAGLGARVHLLEQESEILPGQDRDLAGPVQETLEALGVRLRLGARVVSAGAGRSPFAARRVARLRRVGWRSNWPAGRSWRCSACWSPACARPTSRPAWREAGVACAADRIPVDEQLPHQRPPRSMPSGTSTACAAWPTPPSSRACCCRGPCAGGSPAPAAYPSPPRALFTIPEIAGAGLQERELKARGVPFRRARVELADTWRGLSRGLREGFLKALAAPDGRLLGIWVCAENASELAAPFGPLLERGATVEEVRRSLFIHPTLAEGLLEAVRRL